MTTRQAGFTGSGIGLLVSIAVLVLLGFGVSGILYVGSTDFMYVLWPSSLILTVGWRSTPSGIIITALSVAMNCLTYAAGALLVRAGMRSIVGIRKAMIIK